MIKTLSLILMAILALPACKKEAPGPAVLKQAEKVQKTEPAQGMPSTVKPEEKKIETETYIYDPKGRRDPFLSIIEATKKEKELERRKKGLKPAETFDIADLKIIAIAWDKDRYYAMIQFPDNKYITIKEGITLGLYGGKVIKIDKGNVVVREYVKNYKGEVEPRDTILKLRKEEGE